MENTIEVIVMVGVIGNFLIQSYWLYWTLKNHNKGEHDGKHF